MKKHLFFDLDDTLIVTNPIFEQINKENSVLIEGFLGDENTNFELILKTFNETDLANAQKHGLTPERYIHSWIQTYDFFTAKLNKTKIKSDLETIKENAQKVFKTKSEMYPHVENVLKEIKNQGYEMNILTAGGEGVQKKRVNDAGLAIYFDNIYVVPYKSPQVLLDVLENRDKDKSVMIGNSLRSDIHPALSNDIHAIHIPQDTWLYDEFEIKTNHPKYKRIENITELPNTLNQIKEEIAL